MVSKCIGIVSYLPDNEPVRSRRLSKLKNLLLQLYKFNLPIIIISQNYRKEDYIINPKITYHSFDKLGIVGARNKLREIFLEKTDYDYLIMIDDDCYLSVSNVDSYLLQIDMHPSGFGEFKKSLLKLFAISRDLLREVAFDPNVNPENEEGFEDRVFVNTLRAKYPSLKYVFTNTGISEHSISTKDPDTTWYKGQNLSSMLDRTKQIIDELNS